MDPRYTPEEIWIDEERRRYRREKRLDLEWARVSYGVALVSGSGLALGVFSTGTGIFGLWAAFLGAWFLDRHIVAEVVERSVR